MSQFFVNLDIEKKERFAMAKFFQYTDNFDPLTSYFTNALPNLPTSGYYSVKGEEGRPDLLSFGIYGDTQYWWILLVYNGKIEFDSFKTGDIVKFPSIEAVEDLFFSLKAKENASK